MLPIIVKRAITWPKVQVRSLATLLTRTLKTSLMSLNERTMKLDATRATPFPAMVRTIQQTGWYPGFSVKTFSYRHFSDNLYGRSRRLHVSSNLCSWACQFPAFSCLRSPIRRNSWWLMAQQRLQSLRFFYEGVIRRKEFALRGVTDELSGLTFKSLTEEDRRRLDNSIIHATIFAQEDPEDDRK